MAVVDGTQPRRRWRGGRAQDRSEAVPVDVRLGFPCPKAVAYDPINGVGQELVVTPSQGGALLKGVLVRDCPLIIRLAGQDSPAASPK